MTESRAELALLDSLAQALGVQAEEPSAEALLLLRMAVAEHHGLVGAGARAGAAGTPRWRRLFRRGWRAPRP